FRTTLIHGRNEMLRGLYSVAGALEIAGRNHEVVAENLANIATPGYRRQGTFFDMSQFASNSTSTTSQPNARPPRASQFTYVDGGPLQQTNNPLDLALVGNAYFVLDSPSGPVYTRNGSFEIGPGGELQARGSGYRVRGQGSQISLPQNVSSIEVAADGTISANGAPLGRLELASFAQTDSLQRVGPTLFQGTAPQTPTPGSYRIEQGFKEGSNVQAVQEMVTMMVGMRHYEAAQRSMRAISEAVAQNTRTQS
ncbi:MAG: flagellar hook basal-body protein, partial [Planctomycetota bacterium]